MSQKEHDDMTINNNYQICPITEPEVQQLSELHSQQIALLGYIQIDEKIWYVTAMCSLGPDFNTRHESDRGQHIKIVINNKRKMYYLLTPDQSQALRIHKP